jgi:hypothetical protein
LHQLAITNKRCASDIARAWISVDLIAIVASQLDHVDSSIADRLFIMIGELIRECADLLYQAGGVSVNKSPLVRLCVDIIEKQVKDTISYVVHPCFPDEKYPTDIECPACSRWTVDWTRQPTSVG